MVAASIQELTKELYKELSYNSASKVIKGNFMKDICKLINRCGFKVKETNKYTEEIAQAVSKFQEVVGLKPTGTLDTTTYQSMVIYADNLMSNEITDDENGKKDDTTTSENIDKSDSPHYSSFFSEDRYKTHRQNKKNIKIVLGTNSVVKTIIDVYMRSVSVEVDTSGNPISEVYEFIARDIKESDEISDINKYTGTSKIADNPSQVAFAYPSGKPKKPSKPKKPKPKQPKKPSKPKQPSKPKKPNNSKKPSNSKKPNKTKK